LALPSPHCILRASALKIWFREWKTWAYSAPAYPKCTGRAFDAIFVSLYGAEKGGELHIVLVHNGRSRRLGMTEFWHSLKCILCGACMDTCPVYRRSGGLAYGAPHSGPIGAILDPTVDEFKYSELPFHSTLCGSCSEVCPVKSTSVTKY